MLFTLLMGAASPSVAAGGFFVGAKGGFSHIEMKVKSEERQKASKSAAVKDAEAAVIKATGELTTAENAAKATVNEATNFNQALPALTDQQKKDILKAIDELKNDANDQTIAQAFTANGRPGFAQGKEQNVVKLVKAFLDKRAAKVKAEADKKAAEDKKESDFKNLDAIKNTSSGGIVLAEAGYMHYFDANWGVGAAVEAGYRFGTIKVKTDHENTLGKGEYKTGFDGKFIVSGRYQFNEKAYLGLEAGIALMQLRHKDKDAKSTDDKKDKTASTTITSPVIGASFGMMITPQIEASLTGRWLPSTKRDLSKLKVGDATVPSAKANFTGYEGLVGVRYYFGV